MQTHSAIVMRKYGKGSMEVCTRSSLHRVHLGESQGHWLLPLPLSDGGFLLAHCRGNFLSSKWPKRSLGM